MSKTQRWEWAIGLQLEELSDKHLQLAYKLNWDNLCKFDSCRKNCKRTLCLACFDRSWIDNDSANNSGYDHYDSTNVDQKRSDLKSYVGLKNLGATCYVNCLLQLWFHHPALRKAIYEWDKDSCSVSDETTNGNSSNNNNNNIKEVVTPKSETFNQSPSSKQLTPHKRPREVDDKGSARKMLKMKDELALTPTKQIIASPCTKISERQQQTKPKDPVQTNNPIEQLQLIFARLQFTNKRSIDPFSFIDSLALNAAEQQDAQEFGNLFMEFLEKSFANQKNSFVSKIIQEQFCGKYSYATICDACKQSSLSDSNFYELDLSIQNLETLNDCLKEFFRPVPLDGKYNCSRCQKAQSAHRKIILKSLPPTLNLQLLRFVYDVQRNVRQKLNSHIIFPEVLDMRPFIDDVGVWQSSDSSIYLLSAVLIHRGSSPHSGHYIAHIRDRITKDWYKFNDDSVERIGSQLQVSTDGENITIVDGKSEIFKIADPRTGRVTRVESKNLKSKTAYMLVYQREDNPALFYPSDHSEDWALPEHLQTAVLEENSRSDELFESLQIAREVDEQIINVRKNQIRTIYEKLICRDPTDQFEFIDKQWLQRWITNSSSSAKFDPIDNSHLLCIHDKLDFRKIDQVKCVRTEGADMLYNEFGAGPRLQDSMCKRCVELEVRLIQLKERLKEEQKYITSQAKFKLDANYDFADAYIVGKKSYRVWQNLVMIQFENSHPELASRKSEETNLTNNHHNSSDEEAEGKTEKAGPVSNSDSEDDDAIEKFTFNSDVLCEHNQLIHDTSAWRIVPKEVWSIFKNYFGNDPGKPLIELNANTLMCADCKRQEDEQQEIGDALKQKASEQKSKLPDLFHNRKRATWCTMVPGDEYYAVDRSFLTKWRQFLRNPCNLEIPKEVSNSEKLLCEHGKMLYDHSNSNPVLGDCNFVLVTREELDGLKSFYPVDKDIRFYIDQEKAERKRKLHIASLKVSPSKKSAHLDGSGDTDNTSPQIQTNGTSSIGKNQVGLNEKKLDLDEIDWSECVVSEPGFCSECHEMLKQDELKKLLNYSTTTIYITRVENVNGNNNLIVNENCDNDTAGPTSEETTEITKRKKMYLEDENNDFVPPGGVVGSKQSQGSILRRTTRRKSKKDQAYEIKPSQTLLELKKQIFSRCQVLPVDQKLYLDGTLLDDNTKTMSELTIVPYCSLELEVDRPVSDSVDLIEDEPPSRKSSAQPETGFKGSLLLSNSHL